MAKIWLSCWALVILVACQGNKSTSENCPLGTPTAIYSSDLNFVKRHSFESKGQESEEEVVFTDGLELTIRQSGCQSIRQDYIFQVASSNTDSTLFWVEKSIRLFGQLGSYSENFYSYNLWADKISEFKSEFRLTEPFEVAPNISVKIDKIADPVQTKLIISLLQE